MELIEKDEKNSRKLKNIMIMNNAVMTYVTGNGGDPPTVALSPFGFGLSKVLRKII